MVSGIRLRTYNNNNEKNICAYFIIRSIHSNLYLLLSNRPHFLGLYWRNKTTRDVGRTREKLVNHEPSQVVSLRQ